MRCHCHLNFRMQCHDSFSDCPRWYHLSSTLRSVAYISINHYYGCLSQRKRTSLCELRSDLKIMKNSLDFCFVFPYKARFCQSESDVQFCMKGLDFNCNWMESRWESFYIVQLQRLPDYFALKTWSFYGNAKRLWRPVCEEGKLDERKCIIIYRRLLLR